MSKYDFMFLDVLGHSYQNKNFFIFFSIFFLSQFVCESLVTNVLNVLMELSIPKTNIHHIFFINTFYFLFTSVMFLYQMMNNLI